MKINRSFQIRNLDDNSRIIEGQAICFDVYSRDLGGFVEKIESSAITQDELSSFDIICNYNHNDNKMLARYTKGQGTLELELREDGLYFRFECPNTAFGDEILYHVRKHNISECSFAALISRDNIKRYKENGQYIQVITKIDQILDVSLVNRAAYSDTYVSARNEEEAKNEFEEIKKEVDEKEKEDVREQDCEKDKDKEDVREQDCDKDKEKEDVREQDCNKEKEEKEEKDPDDPDDPDDLDDPDDPDDLDDPDDPEDKDDEEVKRALIINKLDEKLREFYKNI